MSQLTRTLPCLLVTLCLVAPPARAEDYYVDSTRGDDTRDGKSPETAWRDLAKASAKEYAPGDRLLLKSGCSWTGPLRPRGSGTAERPIVLGRYGNGPRPVIHGNGVTGGALTLENQQYWTIANLEITNHGSRQPRKQGILVRNNSVGTLRGIEIICCHIHDVAGDMEGYRDGKESGAIAFVITAANLKMPSRWEDIRIENNLIHDVARNGILMQSQWINKPRDPNSSWKNHGDYTPSTRVRIAGNHLERIGGDGIIPWCVKDAVVERNVVRDANNNPFKQGHAAIWPYFCEDVVFQFNVVSRTRTRFDGMAFDLDNSNQRCVYQFNLSHHNEGGFLNMCSDGNSNGNVARYNVSVNDGCTAASRVFLVHGDGNHDYRIYGNLVFVQDGNPEMFHQGARSAGSSIWFGGNLFINAGKGPCKPPQGCQFEGNMFLGNGHRQSQH